MSRAIRRPRVGRPFLAAAAAASLTVLLSCASAPSEAPAAPPKPNLDAVVTAASQSCGCRMGIAARHLESGRSFEHNADVAFEAASVIKIAILTEAMDGVRRGEVDLAERWSLTGEGKADGSGVLQLLDPGLAPTWNDLITLMIGPSDNTATNAWIDRLGVDAVNAKMASLGYPNLRLFGALPRLSAASAEPSPWTGFRFGSITPREVAAWMSRVAEGSLIDPETSRRIFEYLDKDPSRLRIARRFPPADLWAGKTGTMRGVRNDSGILRTKKGRFVIAVFTDGSTAEGGGPADHPSVLAIAAVSRAIVDAWSAELPDVTDKPK
jgi:beta-lactamase class A